MERTVEQETPGALRLAASWLPLFVLLVLFAQIAFLGLRPALAERRRLAEAETVLLERHARDVELARRLELQLLAREDPIFVERQRRLRMHEALAARE